MKNKHSKMEESVVDFMEAGFYFDVVDKDYNPKPHHKTNIYIRKNKAVLTIDYTSPFSCMQIMTEDLENDGFNKIKSTNYKKAVSILEHKGFTFEKSEGFEGRICNTNPEVSPVPMSFLGGMYYEYWNNDIEEVL